MTQAEGNLVAVHAAEIELATGLPFRVITQNFGLETFAELGLERIDDASQIKPRVKAEMEQLRLLRLYP